MSGIKTLGSHGPAFITRGGLCWRLQVSGTVVTAMKFQKYAAPDILMTLVQALTLRPELITDQLALRAADMLVDIVETREHG